MLVNAFANDYCIHSHHLFAHPLCENQPLLKRIANVVFHVLTLGIPLAVYHVYCALSNYWANKGDIEQENGDIQAIGVNAVQQNKDIKPYSKLGREALEFARKKLEEHPEITPTQFGSGWNGVNGTNQPVNQEIARLHTLYWDVVFKNFEDLMKQNKDNPWSNQDVINAADECMKISYAISNLTLDDLKAFTENLLSNKREKRTYAEALAKQDSYQYRTFYDCTNTYHWFRGGITWGTLPCWNDDDENEEGLIFPRGHVIAPTHAEPFYEKGTIQNTWNSLYNDYCDRVRLYVKEDVLRKADNRHANWTKKDTGVKSFSRVPDTMPT